MDEILYWLKNPFTGRLTRTKYFWYGFIVNSGFKTLDKIDGFLALIVFLILWFIDTSFYVKRLHDFNRSGWLLMIPTGAYIVGFWTFLYHELYDAMVIIIFAILVVVFFKLYLLCTAGTPGPNKYGENPRLDKTGMPKNRLNNPE